MSQPFLILIAETIAFYLLVLWAHSVRNKVGLAYFYAMIGGFSAAMFGLNTTDVSIDVDGMILMLGSTIFYTALLLAVFVIYIFDGPRTTRIAIFATVAIALTMPIAASLLQWQMAEPMTKSFITLAAIRIQLALILTLCVDLFFLAIAWEFWARLKIHTPLWLRLFLTLLALMYLDALLFTTIAFVDESNYWPQLQGALFSRLLICLLASPCLFAYVYWQRHSKALSVDMQPMLTIYQEMTDMRRALAMAQQEVEHHKQVERELESQIHTDELTKVANRRFFDMIFDSEWKRALRSRRPLTIIMCEIDHFDLYHAHYGQMKRDECLHLVAQTIRQSLHRPADMVARYAGESLVIVLPETTMVDAVDIAERICRLVLALAIEHQKSLTYPSVTVSLGVASCRPNLTPQPITLIEQAQKALANAQHAGRNCVSPQLTKVTKAFMRIA